MRAFYIFCFLTVMAICCTPNVSASVKLYRGLLESTPESPQTCGAIQQSYGITLVITTNEKDSEFHGYFTSDLIASGKFYGSDVRHLDIIYPGQSENVSSGNFISITDLGETLSGNFNAVFTSSHCKLNLGSIMLQHVNDQEATQKAIQKLADIYAAQSFLYNALTTYSASGDGNCADSTPLFEKAFALADKSFKQDSVLLYPYIRGLGRCYAMLGEYDKFISLYEKRIESINDKQTKSMIDLLYANVLTKQGEQLALKGESNQALNQLKKAYQINPLNRETVSSIVAAYILYEKRYQEAIAFLDQSISRYDSEDDRKEIYGITAMVYFKKGQKEISDGNLQGAEKSLRKAVGLAPEKNTYLLALARLRHKTGNYKEADGMLAEKLKKSTNEAERNEIIEARLKMSQTEMILKKTN